MGCVRYWNGVIYAINSRGRLGARYTRTNCSLYGVNTLSGLPSAVDRLTVER